MFQIHDLIHQGLLHAGRAGGQWQDLGAVVDRDHWVVSPVLYCPGYPLFFLLFSRYYH